MSEKKSYIGTPFYRLFKRYVRFVNDRILFRHIYYIDKENLPELGKPCMIVSNHQNGANDPILFLLGLENETHPYVLARGDVFEVNSVLSKIFYWIGMIPVYRLAYEGEESLKKNEDTMRFAGDEMLKGNRLILFPEADHQNKRWLDTFRYGYTRLAFEAAERDNFEHDIIILPCAHHYSSYFGLKDDVMIRYGKPVSIQPYYELYKQKPRTAQREVNKIVRQQVDDMMLDIRDLEHYNEIDWLRESEYGVEYCKKQGLNPNYLPDKLKSDKLLVEELQSVDWGKIDEVIEEEKKLGLTEKDIMNRKGWGITILSMLAQLLLLPLWVVSLYPNAIHYFVPQRFKPNNDPMFENSMTLIVPVLMGIPFFFLLTVLVCGLAWGLWWQSILWMILALYPGSLFAWYVGKWMQSTLHNLKMLLMPKKMKQLLKQRSELYNNINSK